MHGFLSNLTAALLALHTVLGCCWHHAHRCTRECSPSLAVEAPDGCQRNAADDCGAPAASHQGQHGRHGCQESTCVFLGSTRWYPDADCQFDAAPAMLASADCATADADVDRRSFFAPDALLPPLRLHLVDRVLLI
jgi:hypothetical protein